MRSSLSLVDTFSSTPRKSQITSRETFNRLVNTGMDTKRREISVPGDLQEQLIISEGQSYILSSPSKCTRCWELPTKCLVCGNTLKWLRRHRLFLNKLNCLIWTVSESVCRAWLLCSVCNSGLSHTWHRFHRSAFLSLSYTILELVLNVDLTLWIPNLGWLLAFLGVGWGGGAF